MDQIDHLPLLAGLPAQHVVRQWWEGTLPDAGEDAPWPFRPDLDALKRKSRAIGVHPRLALVQRRVRMQYEEAGLAVPGQLASLDSPEVRTVTTGHQLCLAGGPAFTYYKIRTAITLADRLSAAWGQPVVPVFWLASEDHDFDEVRRLWDGTQWRQWTPPNPVGGPVGRVSSDGLVSAMAEWLEAVSPSAGDRVVLENPGRNLADAMRRWVHGQFGPDAMVVVDGDDPELKASFAEHMGREIKASIVHDAVTRRNAVLAGGGWSPQVHVRPCNLFHLTPGGRHRLERKDQGWHTASGQHWPDDAALLDALERDPAAFSPNALLRPVYQSFLLPDVAVVGGLAEVAYWLQLPGAYAHFGVEQPALVPRDGAVVLPRKWAGLMVRSGVTISDLNRPWAAWEAQWVNRSSVPDVREWRAAMRTHAETTRTEFSALDASLVGSVEAGIAKIEAVLDRLDQQAVRAFKRREQDDRNRLERLHGWVMPDGQAQERVAHFVHLKTAWDREAEADRSLVATVDRAFEEGHQAGNWRPLMHILIQGAP